MAFGSNATLGDLVRRGATRRRSSLSRRPRLAEAVGIGRPNRPDDVATVEGLLRETGHVAPSSNPPTGLFGGFLRDATSDFQRRNRLTVDGILEPDGETFGALLQALDDDVDEGGPLAEADAKECGRLTKEIKDQKGLLDKIRADIERVSGDIAGRSSRDPDIESLRDGLTELHRLRLRQERVVRELEQRFEEVCVSSA